MQCVYDLLRNSSKTGETRQCGGKNPSAAPGESLRAGTIPRAGGKQRESCPAPGTRHAVKYRSPRVELSNSMRRAGNASDQTEFFKRFRKAVFIHFAADHIGAFFEFFASVAHTYADSGSFNHL